jgi:Cu+-exporting ATPase
VTEVIQVNGNPEDLEGLLALTASAEQGSEHPVARAIVRYARDRGVKLESPAEFEAHAGMGITARVSGKPVLAGKPDFISQNGLEFNRSSEIIEQLESKGHTVILAVVDGRVGLIIAVADRIRPEAGEVVARLKETGLEVYMITGDNKRVARTVAEQIGIGQVVAEVLPGDKAARIAQIQQDERKKVGMVGDGINDAPALAQADVGISLSSGTDIAMETADITLVRPDLRGVIFALRLSRATLRLIRQNLFWAFIYNILLIPVAAGILHPVAAAPEFLRSLHPVMAALAMAFSSVSVVSNSLRLRMFRLDRF